MTSKEIDAIGIDLGTTYSCVAYFTKGGVEVACNKEGKPTTPSVVSFNEEPGKKELVKLVGEAALYKKTTNPASVFYDAKRLIGRSFDDPVIQKFISNWPFKIVRWDLNQKKETSVKSKDTVDNIKFKFVHEDGKVSYFDPVQISAYVLMEMKEAAEQSLGKKIEKAVITVPAHFKDSQRQSTLSAARIAGFKEVRLLNEPTAAALAYGYKRSKDEIAKQKDERVLVYDLGGGTFDVSCLNFESCTDQGGIAETLATEGDTFLGGRDFDNEIFDYVLKCFCEKNGVSINSISDKSKRRLRIECERAKRILSSTLRTTVEIDYFHDGTELSVEVSRAMFEQLCSKYFKRCMERVEGLLMTLGGTHPVYNSEGFITNKKQNLINQEKAKIHKCILVGGSSRIPIVQNMLKDLFGESKVCSPVHPDEAVAFGAAFQAALVMCPEATNQSESLLLMDTVPLDIGCETAGGVFTVIIKRNSTIPIRQKQVFTTYADNQPSVTINIYEGTRPMVADNTLLGSFNLDGIPPAPRGVPQIEISCDVDNSGCLKVTACDLNTRCSNSITITDLKGKLSQEDIDRMIAEADKYRESDDKRRMRAEKKNLYEAEIFKVKTIATQSKNETLLSACSEHERWLANNPDPEVEELDQRIKMLEELVKSSGAGVPPQGCSDGPVGDGPSVEEVN